MLSVETQDELLDLLSAAAGESRLTPMRWNPAFSRNPQRCGIVRGCAGEQCAFSANGEEALERGAGDTSAPERAIDPIGHLGPVVDP